MAEARDGGILCAAAQQVLETMFFTSIMGERRDPPDDPALEALVSFEGEPQGSFGLKLSASAARAIAANFLGVEDEAELTDSQIGEVACELANMICGTMLSQVESGSTFNISHPRLAAPGDANGLAGRTERSFDLDNGALGLWVSFGGN
jgi:CheY-specific phosphatase CheX